MTTFVMVQNLGFFAHVEKLFLTFTGPKNVRGIILDYVLNFVIAVYLITYDKIYSIYYVTLGIIAKSPSNVKWI